MLVGIAVVFVAWLVPVKRQGIRIHSWVITWICRIINWLLRIKVFVPTRKLIDLQGIAFHQSRLLLGHPGRCVDPAHALPEHIRRLSCALRRLGRRLDCNGLRGSKRQILASKRA
jgi:hypothetical protein